MILVIGGAGYIGSHVNRTLKLKGYKNLKEIIESAWKWSIKQ